MEWLQDIFLQMRCSVTGNKEKPRITNFFFIINFVCSDEALQYAIHIISKKQNGKNSIVSNVIACIITFHTIVVYQGKKKEWI